jgi:hypothetical protein
MLSRIFWIAAAGIALVAGVMVRDGGWIFDSNDRAIDASIDRAVDRTIDRTIDRRMDGVQVVGADGHELQVSSQTKQQFADAVGRLVEAESDFALLRVGGTDGPERNAAAARRDQARREVSRLKAEIKQQGQPASLQRNAAREQIRDEIRDDIRSTVRDAVGN